MQEAIKRDIMSYSPNKDQYSDSESSMDSEILNSMIEPKQNAQSYYKFQHNTSLDGESEVVMRVSKVQDKITDF